MNEGGSCKNASMGFLSVKHWQQNVNELRNASLSALHAMPMIANAGCYSIGLESLSDAYYAQLVRFGYASFLLGVDQRNTTVRFGLPAMRYLNDGKGPRVAVVDDIFKIKIGDPAETKQNVSEYSIGGAHCSYQRRFENGMVLKFPRS